MRFADACRRRLEFRVLADLAMLLLFAFAGPQPWRELHQIRMPVAYLLRLEGSYFDTAERLFDECLVAVASIDCRLALVFEEYEVVLHRLGDGQGASNAGRGSGSLVAPCSRPLLRLVEVKYVSAIGVAHVVGNAYHFHIVRVLGPALHVGPQGPGACLAGNAAVSKMRAGI